MSLKGHRGLRPLLAGLIVAATLVIAAPASADVEPITNVEPPTVSGTPQFEETLTAEPGSWTPDDVALTYQWLRDGQPVSGRTGPTVQLTRAADLHATFAVRVTASRPGTAPVTATSAPTGRVGGARFTNVQRPSISGTPKFRKTLTRSLGTWSEGGITRTTQWFRDGRQISGATGRTYVLGPSDVGKKISVRVTGRKTGHWSVAAMSRRTGTVQHLRPVRKTVTYRVVTRGSISTSVSTFRRQAKETLNDARGWRGMGIAFKEVSSGGSFTLVLSQASKVPSYSSACSSAWSCRVGRYVIINQSRWTGATPAWKTHHGSLRNYRHMVVNHEVGHWLGRGHASCGGKGQLAPVMQQQSKGLAGCKINPWPKTSELHSPRFGY